MNSFLRMEEQSERENENERDGEKMINDKILYWQ